MNPNNDMFRMAVRSEIYVDKTGLIAETNKLLGTENRFLCISRPRRFGKSMAMNMLCAYYSRGCDSGELFSGYRIAQEDMVTFSNRDDVLTLLIHLGYLTYDFERQEVRIPNQEIMGEYATTIKVLGWSEIAEALRESEELLRATLDKDSLLYGEKEFRSGAGDTRREGVCGH